MAVRSGKLATVASLALMAAWFSLPQSAVGAGFIAAAPLNPPRSVSSVVLLPSGRIYAGAASDSTSANIYNPATNIWSPAAAPAFVSSSGTATVLQAGLLLLAGGSDVDGYIHADAQLYDETTDTWTPATPMLIASSGNAAVRLQSGKVLVAGGWTNGMPVSTHVLNASAQLSDPATNSWSLAGTLAFPRDLSSMTLLQSGKVLLAGGTNAAGRVEAVELYDPAMNSWSLASPILEPRFWHSATLLADGRVLVAGGDAFGGRTASTELYDPISDSWSPGAALTFKRDLHTATLLPDGNVLVIGGYDFPTIIANAELYDVATGLWIPAGTSVVPRLLHSARVLSSGRVFVMGGRNNGGALSSTELYAPETTVSLSTSPAPTDVGQLYQVDVMVSGVSGVPTGTVTVDDGAGETCGPAVVFGGAAACSLNSVFPGTRQVNAHFEPDDAAFSASSASVDHLINVLASEITIVGVDPEPSVVGQPVDFSFTVSAGATGSVTVSAITGEHCDASVAIGHCAIVFAVDGPRSVNAHYSGDETYAESTSGSVSHVVNEASTTLSITSHSPDPSIPYQAIIVAVSFSVQSPGGGTPSGAIHVGDGVDECVIAQGKTNGQCELTLSTRGSRSVTAQYLGDGDYSPSEDSVVQHVNVLPTAGPIAYVMGTGGELSVPASQGLLSTAQDDDGDAIEILNVGPQSTQGIGGTVTINSDGSFVFIPAGSAVGDAQFPVSLSDGHETVYIPATISVFPMADLAVALDDTGDFVEGGSLHEYTLEVRNRGALAANGASVHVEFSSNYVDVAWSCVGDSGATCGGAGSGTIDDIVDIPSGARILYAIHGSVLAQPEVPLIVSARISPAKGVMDANPTNDEATDLDAVGIFADGVDGTE
jgi:hypothetical protein